MECGYSKLTSHDNKLRIKHKLATDGDRPNNNEQNAKAKLSAPAAREKKLETK